MAFPPSTPLDFVEEDYIGFYNRAGDAPGANFWINQLNTNSKLGVAVGFAVSSESLAIYPYLSAPNVIAPQTYIDQIYSNVFGRVADSAGESFWVNRLAQLNTFFSNADGSVNQANLQSFAPGTDLGRYGSTLTQGGKFVAAVEVLTEMLNSVNLQTGTTDANLMANRITVAEDYTTRTGNSNTPYSQASSKAVIAATNSNAASVPVAEAVTTAYITGTQNNPNPTTFTTSTDNFTSAQSNLALTGVVDTGGSPNASTVQVFDQVNPSGSNSVTITHVGTGSGLSSANVPVLNNVTSLTETNLSTAAETFALAGIAPNVTSLGVLAGSKGVAFTGFSGTQTNTFNVANYTGAAATDTFTPNTGLTSGGAATGSATLNVSGLGAVSGAGLVTVALGGSSTDGFATVSVVSGGAVTNDLVALTDSALKTLNISGSAALKIDGSIAFNGGVVNVQAGTDTGGLTIDVSGNGGKATFVGGTAGTEKLTVSDASLLTSGTSIAGGAGTADTFTDAGLAAAATAGEYAALNKITGFEILGVTTTSTVDDSLITATFQNHFAVSGAGALTVANLVNNATVDISNSSTDVLGGAVGTNAITINEGGATGGLGDVLTVTGLNTVALSSNGASANVVGFTNSDNTSFTITGAAGLTMTVSGATTTGDKVDASALTGAFTYTDSGKGDVILAGSGTTLLVAKTAASAVDTYTLLAGHTKVDTISTTAIDSTGLPTIDKITNFALNQDILTNNSNFLHQGTELGATAGTGIIAPGSFASLSALLTSANATTAAAAGDTVAWSDGTNTFVVEFVTTATNSAHVVEMVGLTGVTAVGTAVGAGHLLVA